MRQDTRGIIHSSLRIGNLLSGSLISQNAYVLLAAVIFDVVSKRGGKLISKN